MIELEKAWKAYCRRYDEGLRLQEKGEEQFIQAAHLWDKGTYPDDGDKFVNEGIKLIAKGNRLLDKVKEPWGRLQAEMGQDRAQLWAKCIRVLADGDKLIAEGSMRLAEGSKRLAVTAKFKLKWAILRAKAAQSWTKGFKLLFDAERAWIEAVRECRGSSYTVLWLNRLDGKHACELGTGEVFEPI
jgi:hypothetical protein